MVKRGSGHGESLASLGWSLALAPQEGPDLEAWQTRKGLTQVVST